MKRALVGGLVAAIVGAAVGFSAVWVQMAPRRAEARAAQRIRERFSALQRVVVAASDVRAGGVLELDSLAERKVPRALVPADAVEPELAGTLLRQRVLFPLSAGEPIRRSHLAHTWSEESLETACSALREGKP